MDGGDYYIPFAFLKKRGDNNTGVNEIIEINQLHLLYFPKQLFLNVFLLF